MKRALRNSLLAAGFGCGFSLVLTNCALAGTGARFDASDITKPDFFPILPWDPYHGWNQPFIEYRQNGLESLAECHFNMAGFVLPGTFRGAGNWGWAPSCSLPAMRLLRSNTNVRGKSFPMGRSNGG